MRATHPTDRRAVSSTIQAVLLVALVTVTVAGIGYAVLGLLLVDDSPEIKQVKLHVSDSGLTVTPMIGDPLPADDVEVSIARNSRDPRALTVDDVARASMAGEAEPFVSGDVADTSRITNVESDLGDDVRAATATWTAGQPVHVETNPGFIQEGDVFTVQVVDRQHQTLLLEKNFRASSLPRTLLLTVDPSPGDEDDPVASDGSDGPSGADRSESGGVVNLGTHWERADWSRNPRLHSPVVARVQDPGDERGGNGPGPGANVDVDLPTIPSDLGGGSGTVTGGTETGTSAGTMAGPETGVVGETIGDTIDASQGNQIAVTNGDGGAVKMSNGQGEQITVIDGETWSQANDGHATGTLPLSAFDQGIQNRVGSSLQGHTSARADTICNCPSPAVDGTDAGGQGDLSAETAGGESGPASGSPDSGAVDVGESPSSGVSGSGGDGGVLSGLVDTVVDGLGFGDGGDAIGGVGADSVDGTGGIDTGVGGGVADPGLDLNVGGVDVDVSSIDVGGISI